MGPSDPLNVGVLSLEGQQPQGWPPPVVAVREAGELPVFLFILLISLPLKMHHLGAQGRAIHQAGAGSSPPRATAVISRELRVSAPMGLLGWHLGVGGGWSDPCRAVNQEQDFTRGSTPKAESTGARGGSRAAPMGTQPTMSPERFRNPRFISDR